MISHRTDSRYLPHNGRKVAFRDLRAAVSAQHPATVDAAVEVLRAGGSAADAAVAAVLTEATVLNNATSLGGIMNCIYWSAAEGRAYQIIGTGRLPPHLPPFRPLPQLGMVLTASPPAACIPGLMPALGALHQRFGKCRWSSLCEPALGWALEGYPMSSRLFSLIDQFLPFTTYFPEGRALFLDADGQLPPVGTLMKNPALATTLRQLASEGPECFVSGTWARAFVNRCNELGWPIRLEDLALAPARVGAPLEYTIGEHRVLQLAPPEALGVVSAIVLQTLAELDYDASQVGTAEAAYWIVHALRWALKESGFINDPEAFAVPTDLLVARETARYLANLIERSTPRVDLTEHVRLTSGRAALDSVGLAGAAASCDIASPQTVTPLGTCSLCIVDAQGDWVQLTHTLQSGGFPGLVVGGVPMYGSHMSVAGLSQGGSSSRLAMSGWLHPQGRMRCYLGDTLVVRKGAPWLALGTPASPHFSVPQVLADILLGGLTPPAAAIRPRVSPLEEDYSILAEGRVQPSVIAGLARRGIRTSLTRPWDGYVGGSFQMCWRGLDGSLHADADPRGMSTAGGLSMAGDAV